MILSSIREGELKSVFQALETAFHATGIDYYIIGALARDVWFSRGQKKFRATRDIDFAVLVGTAEAYDALRKYLQDYHQYSPSLTNSFVMVTPDGIPIDILPFGAIAIDDHIHIDGQGLTSIQVDGFAEVYQNGTIPVELETGHTFEVATLASIVLLKLIAYDDRPEKRSKDPRDIATIIEHYFSLNDHHIWDHHTDVFRENDSRTLEEIAAVVIGKEIKTIVSSNPKLLSRVTRILTLHISAFASSDLIRQMVAENKKTVEENAGYLKAIFSGLQPGLPAPK